ncbi:hypothetical protein TWF569_002949 [Orbilia oligospora]|uniref:Uncharacterized protein n=1 Tax=Orbilia oligospora TaxID=2813651 RepID=A0A7C8JUC9_ORBOL|nr:hypothetical protein TWF706_007422 [Orbilia oligospora]KAF3111457.1 hypothetical protein TWF102_007121 [Orbilia oligospora]KAF3117283.1 hypothetical protein TWF103_007425 [Orbilia oligospora]KAF3140324.1 hypothetical protein TWF703_003197 [Orbilia oligospora]KAF3140779.1 hypothetical protein TWF594_006278 [Orbilia oligospora]
MSSSTTTTVSSTEEPPKSNNTNPKSHKGFRVPRGYYFLVLFSPLLIGLSFVLLGLGLILTGVLLVLAAPAFLIIGPFIIPRNVTSDDPRWGWKWLLDKNANDFRDWVRERVVKGRVYFKGKAD